jgi:glycerol 3-phosphatase-2
VRPVERYDAFLLDLDGVLYRGDEVVPGAAESVGALRASDRAVVFLTNNSARTPGQVAGKLAGMGIEARPDEVVTSAQATARVLARLVAEDGRAPSAFVIGERGVREALGEAGIEVLEGDVREAGFVVVGWDRRVDYAKLRTATMLVHRGARLVATNADPSYPAAGGESWPGAGALVAAVETASGASAAVVGKPYRPLFDEALRRAGTDRALMVGDRIETDVVGAASAGLDAALVLTGAARPADLLDRDPVPSMLLDDVAGLLAERRQARMRDARSEDASALARLLAASGLEPDDLEHPPTGTVVAEGDGLAATAAAAVHGDGAYLHSVAVSGGARGQNVGTLVTAAAIRRAAAAGARTAYLLTETAEGFFARLGFQPVRREDLPGWVAERSTACSENATAMRRSVAAPAGQPPS